MWSLKNVEACCHVCRSVSRVIAWESVNGVLWNFTSESFMKFVNIFHFRWCWTTKMETVCQGLNVFFACGLNTMCWMFIERIKYLQKSYMKNKNAHFIPCAVFLTYLTVSEIFEQSELIYQNFYAVCTFSNLLVILCLIFAWISWQQHFALINFILSVLSNLKINNDTLFNSSYTFYTCVC